MRLKLALPIVLAACLAECGAAAHVGSDVNSIHFHSGRPDFGSLPRRGLLLVLDDRVVNGWVEYSSVPRVGVELDAEIDDARTDNRIRALQHAENAFARADWTEAAKSYRAILVRFGPSGVVKDRIEILQGARNPGTVAGALQEYRRAVSVFKKGTNPAGFAALSRIAANRRYGALADHAAYQMASVTWESGRPRESLPLFRAYLELHPHGAKREEALIMAARAAVLSDKPEERDVAAGGRALDRLAIEFPHTRFRRSAIGLRGRIFYLTAQYRRALDCYISLSDAYSIEKIREQLQQNTPPDVPARLLAIYLRRLAAARTHYLYEKAIEDIWRTRKSFNVRDARNFSRMLDHDLSLPGPYFYVRLYHNENLSKDLGNLARKAADIQRAHPRAMLPPIVQIRFAELEYQRRRYREAIRWAESALASGATEQPGYSFDAQAETVAARALFVRGASRHKQKRFREAVGDFDAILARYPSTPIKRCVREELALVHEDLHDLPGALDQYFALGYQADIALLIDARMSIPELERYVRRCRGTYTDAAMEDWRKQITGHTIPKTVPMRDLLAYSLGVRCLRAGQWDKAAVWLRAVPRETYNQFSRGRREWEGRPAPDPLTAARELAHLDRAVHIAPTSDTRAGALYQLAGYYYSHGTLLLYNPALWKGEREIHFQEYWNASHATPDDLRAVQRYMHEHEVYAHALALYKEAARRYPKSAVAPRALYRAACSASHLCNFNEWWRSDDKGHDHEQQSANLMSRLYHRYPNSPLSKEAAKFARIWSQDALESAKNRAQYAKSGEN
jgi:outer membrane protein assembly factor BamD (BamD/ComL family)